MSAEQEFRDRALELSLGQLAVLFAEFGGVMRYDLRFDMERTWELRRQIAESLATFIADAPVEVIEQGLAPADPNSIECRRFSVEAERKRLEGAGLVKRGEQQDG